MLQAKMLLSYISIVVAILPICLGDKLSPLQYCADSVYEAFGTINFADSSADDYWTSVCQSQLKLISIYASATIHCTTNEFEEGFKILAEYCTEYGQMELLPKSDFNDNLTAEVISGYRVVGFGDVKTTDNLTVPIVLSNDYFDLALRTIVSFDFRIPVLFNYTLLIVQSTWEFETWTHHTYG